MSSELASTVNLTSSGKLSLAALLSVEALYAGLRTRSSTVWPSKPLIGFKAEHDEVLTASAPLIMYGPVETTSRPYLPAAPSKHFVTSAGCGPAAGMATRFRKSPVGAVRVKTIVLELGVLMPEIDFALPLPSASNPLITE